MQYYGSKWRWWLSVVLMITGLSVLIVALYRQSVILALIGVAAMAAGSATPHRKPWESDKIGSPDERPK